MRNLFLIISVALFILGCTGKETIVLKASPESAVQMSDEAERMRAELNRHFKKEDVSTSADSIYLKAMNNEIRE
ncbi:MAG: hypothetical protein M1300_07375 [Epsilonproteobacteria bacterium]|nr:hypothetical protein [Campylobacterota bacterium]